MSTENEATTPPETPEATPIAPPAAAPAAAPRRQTVTRAVPAPAGTLADQYDFGSDPSPEVPAAGVAAPAGTPSTGAAAALSQPAAAPAHPAWLLRAAEFHGLPEADVAEMGTGELRRTVTLLDRQAATLSREFSRSAHLTEPKRGQPAAAAATPPAAEPQLDEELGLSPEDLADFDPRLVSAIKHATKKQADKLAAVEAELKGYRETHQRQQVETTRQRLDRLFDGVAETHGHLFGEGDGQKVTKDLRANRHKVVAAMDAFAQTYQQLGQQVEEEQLFQTALNGMFAGQGRQQAEAPPTPPAGARLTQRQEQWSNGTGLARPTNRHAEEPKGERKALKTATAILKERGQLDPEDELLNSFPD